jgi:iron complex outermembrane receptor protein
MASACRIGVALLLTALNLLAVACWAGDSLVDQSLEDLMDKGLTTPPADVQSSTAAKYAQTSATAPATVRLATAEDIKTYGWRTLGEVLRSFPGVFVSNDRFYDHLGVRGINLAGDFGTRVLLLIDGTRSNDVFDGSYYGNDFVLDVDLIERVEFAPGPGSAIYGNNAFFGVINVITKRGHAYNGAELSGEYRSYDTYKMRGSYGKRYDNGAEVLLSATGFDREGQSSLYFPEFDNPQENYGRAVGLDYDRTQSGFAKLTYKGFLLEAGHLDRSKGFPNAPIGSVFNDPTNQEHDQFSFVNAKYEDNFAEDWGLNVRLGYQHADYFSNYAFASPPSLFNSLVKQTLKGDRWDGELRLLNNSFERHRLLAGVEIQGNQTANTSRIYLPGAPASFAETPADFVRYGVYLQDEFRLLDALTLLAGARYDHSPFGQKANPRAALIWQPLKTTTLKLMYGTAFRTPTPYEAVFTNQNIGYTPPRLRPEDIGTVEIAAEHYLTPATRLAASVYHFDINGLIGLSDTLPSAFGNRQNISGDGMEIEAEQRFSSGVRANLSYALQQAKSGGDGLADSPGHMVKLHLSAPLWTERLRMGLETLYFSERGSKLSGVNDYLLANLTLNASLHKNIDLSFSFYNLADVRYSDPVGAVYRQNSIEQDGRNFRIKLSLRY